MTPTPHPSRVGDDDGRAVPETVKLVISAAESSLSAEYQYTERLEGKARQQATMAATWFAVVQASTAAVIASGKASGAWVLVICIAAILASGFLIESYRKASEVWKPLDEVLIQPPELVTMERDAQENPRQMAHDLIVLYANMLQQRRENTPGAVGRAYRVPALVVVGADRSVYRAWYRVRREGVVLTDGTGGPEPAEEEPAEGESEEGEEKAEPELPPGKYKTERIAMFTLGPDDQLGVVLDKGPVTRTSVPAGIAGEILSDLQNLTCAVASWLAGAKRVAHRGSVASVPGVSGLALVGFERGGSVKFTFTIAAGEEFRLAVEAKGEDGVTSGTAEAVAILLDLIERAESPDARGGHVGRDAQTRHHQLPGARPDAVPTPDGVHLGIARPGSGDNAAGACHGGEGQAGTGCQRVSGGVRGHRPPVGAE